MSCVMLIVIFASFNISILLKKTEAVHWWFCLNLVPFQFGHRMIQSTQPKANTQKFNPNVINCIIWTTFQISFFLLYSCGTFHIATNQTHYPKIGIFGKFCKTPTEETVIVSVLYFSLSLPLSFACYQCIGIR